MNTSRILSLALLFSLAAGALRAAPRPESFALRGAIDGENIRFELKLGVDELRRGESLELLRGDVALLDSQLPAGCALRREGDAFRLVRDGGFGGARNVAVTLTFAARTTLAGDWRCARFALPVLPLRQVAVTTDRPDLEVRFPTGRDLRHDTLPDGKRVASASLSQDNWIEIAWKPEIRRVDSELVAACEINTLAVATPGALRFDSIFVYAIAQGQLGELSFAIPDVNILQVTGADIQDWRIDRGDAAQPRLRVVLGRPQQGEYRLQVAYERALPPFPCEVALPVLTPLGVIRAGGSLLLGTDSAVKLQVANAVGVTQIDQAAFPRVAALQADAAPRTAPGRSVFTYQYAALPYALTLSADNIASAQSAEVGLLVSVGEGQITLDAAIQLDVRDAPAREARIVTDADARWTLVGVTGAGVNELDVDIRAVGATREIRVPFRQPVEGQTVINLRLELPLGLARDSFTVPAVTLPEARSQRGYLVAAAERGIRFVPRAVRDLRDVHTASTPFRVEGAQLAYRFREPGWQLELGLEWARAAIHSELFHLISLGEGVVYVSAAVNCHISGAPVQTLRFRVPGASDNMEIVGVGIDNWTRSNDVCSVQLATRAMGDFTLLLSYDQPLGYGDAVLPVGGIETLDTASEMGFIAVATSANLRIEESGGLSPTLLRIPRDELPAGYAATVTAPIIGTYKYTRRPHVTPLRITPLETHRPIGQVVDFLTLDSRLGRDGESVTHATYHVKNASQQYLTARLPPGAALWSVRQGIGSEARELPAQQTGENLLIPVERPRDPNQAMPVEIVYAQPAALGKRRWGRVQVAAPLLVETPVTFAKWTVTADGNRAIGACGGNLTPDGDRRAARTNPSGRLFYRTAILAGEPPLRIELSLMPAWMAYGSPRVLIGAGAAGLLALLLALRRRHLLDFALSGTLLALAAYQTLPGHGLLPVAAAIAVPLALLLGLIRVVVRRRRNRRASRVEAPPPPLMPDAAPAASAPPAGEGGYVTLRQLLLNGAAAAGLLLGRVGATEPAPATNAVLPLLLADRIEVAVQAPALDPRVEPTAVVEWQIAFHAEAPGAWLLFPASTVVAQTQVDSTRLRLVSRPEGVAVEVLKHGAHRIALSCRERVTASAGAWSLTLPWPSNLMNRMTLTIPAADLEVQSAQAAYLRTTSGAGATRGELAIDAAAERVVLTWQPRARDTRSEAAVVYADLLTVARLRPGVVDCFTLARYNVAQGEAREFRLIAPEGMTVTAVNAPSLATWRFDPLTRRVEAILARPVSGPLEIALTLQAPCGGLPYDLTLGAPQALDIQRQRGRLALSAPEAILLRVNTAAGVTAIDTADFDLRPFSRKPEQATVEGAELRRAFRYDAPEAVRLALRAEEVQPEIRVSEASSFSLADERNMLSSSLEITIAKSGIFSLRLEIPEGYEIETLTGRDVSHWDDSRRAEHGVEIFLNRRVQDTTPLNIVLSQPQRGIPDRLPLPRLAVQGAARHTGRMVVAAERGVKLTATQQEGVTTRRAEGEKLQAGTLAFDLLRPNWLVEIRTQVLAPVLKPELLHCVELAEGMLRHRIHIRYRIENAGIKFFRLRVPVADAPLTVTGSNIARVRPLDEATGGATGRVWEVELNGKVEESYSLTCQYQEPYDADRGGVQVRPFELLDTARQSGYLVITGGGRVQVAPRGAPEGLKLEDARALPDSFGAGDLSGAILCYRALRPDYRLELSVVRHAAAATLPASVENVRLVTVVSSSGRLLTQATLELRVSTLRFLKVVLPSPDCALWSALVNGSEAAVSRDADGLNIPLEGLAAGQSSAVTLVYAATLSGAGLRGRHELLAPRFPELPLREIEWRVFVPPEYRWRILDGDLDSVYESWSAFGQDDYDLANEAVQKSNLGVARGNLQSLDTLLASGKQREARNALQQAVNLSQAEQSLNEDARVQFRNVVRQQVKMGLVNRRQALRADNNIYDERGLQEQTGWNGGDFNAQYARQVDEQLDAQDRAGLDRVAQKLVDQQAAAVSVAGAIRMAMPEHGREFHFRRTLQNERGGRLALRFRVRRPPAVAGLLALWPVIPACLLLWGLLRIACGPAKPRV